MPGGDASDPRPRGRHRRPARPYRPSDRPPCPPARAPRPCAPGAEELPGRTTSTQDPQAAPTRPTVRRPAHDRQDQHPALPRAEPRAGSSRASWAAPSRSPGSPRPRPRPPRRRSPPRSRARRTDPRGRSYYSADPAPLVVPAGAPGNATGADQLYVYTGHDEAGPRQNDFIMNEWGAFVTSDVDAGEWTHHPSLMRPEEVFDWATPGAPTRARSCRAWTGATTGTSRARGGQPGERRVRHRRRGLGVPDGPWTDHVGAPIISQRVPTPNTIHNIDPTVLVDGEGDDARVYVWWGSFSNLRMLELGRDENAGRPGPHGHGPHRLLRGGVGVRARGHLLHGLRGERRRPDVRVHPASYHACIAYGTASSPEGPWTYRGTVLAPVSSTTSHPGILEFDGEWWIAYHTADAEGGNHFRRSVAIDRVEWDDTQSPPRMKQVVTTPEKVRDTTPRANVAQEATVTVSNEPVPTQYWKKALNDEIVRPNPLPRTCGARGRGTTRPSSGSSTRGTSRCGSRARRSSSGTTSRRARASASRRPRRGASSTGTRPTAARGSTCATRAATAPGRTASRRRRSSRSRRPRCARSSTPRPTAAPTRRWPSRSGRSWRSSPPPSSRPARRSRWARRTCPGPSR